MSSATKKSKRPDRFHRQVELDLIEEAVASGKVRRYPMGATSDWDSKPLREKVRFGRYRGNR